jgi:hypothetical protein
MLPVQHERHGIETCLNASAACARTPTPAQHSQDAHRVWPVNLDVISWLGAFHVRNEVRANFVGCPSSVWVSSALWCTTGHSLVCTRAHADPPRRASVAPPPQHTRTANTRPMPHARRSMSALCPSLTSRRPSSRSRPSGPSWSRAASGAWARTRRPCSGALAAVARARTRVCGRLCGWRWGLPIPLAVALPPTPPPHTHQRCTMRPSPTTFRYQAIVAAHPGSVEALRYLVALCQQAGRPADADRYTHQLRRAEVRVSGWPVV